jgi:quercetin dioxygenase-like cupin family protein
MKNLDAAQVTADVETLYANILGTVETRTDLHNHMQHELVGLSQEYGCRGESKLPVTVAEMGRKGYVDVAWRNAGGALVAAIEIDGSPRQRSVLKLCAVNAPLRLWVYYGFKDLRTVEAFAISETPIYVIHLPRHHLSHNRTNTQRETRQKVGLGSECVKVALWSGQEPPEPATLRGEMEAQGLAPYTWGNAPGERYAAHTHGFHKVIYVARGSITFTLPELGRSLLLHAGDRLDLPAGVLHSAVVGDDGVLCYEAHMPAAGR